MTTPQSHLSSFGQHLTKFQFQDIQFRWFYVQFLLCALSLSLCLIELQRETVINDSNVVDEFVLDWNKITVCPAKNVYNREINNKERLVVDKNLGSNLLYLPWSIFMDYFRSSLTFCILVPDFWEFFWRFIALTCLNIVLTWK